MTRIVKSNKILQESQKRQPHPKHTTTCTATTTTTFLDLPGEIRNEIYRHLYRIEPGCYASGGEGEGERRRQDFIVPWYSARDHRGTGRLYGCGIVNMMRVNRRECFCLSLSLSLLFFGFFFSALPLFLDLVFFLFCSCDGGSVRVVCA